MIAFIDDHRHAYGVEPICRVLPIAPSTYYEHASRERDPERLPDRAKRDVRSATSFSRSTSVASLMQTSGSTACARCGGR